MFMINSLFVKKILFLFFHVPFKFKLMVEFKFLSLILSLRLNSSFCFEV